MSVEAYKKALIEQFKLDFASDPGFLEMILQIIERVKVDGN